MEIQILLNYIFYPFESTWDTSHTFFNFIIQVLFMSYAMQNTHRLLILGCVLKPEVIKRAFWSKKSGLFYFTEIEWMYMHVVWAQNIYNYWNIMQKSGGSQKLGKYQSIHTSVTPSCYFDSVCKEKTKLLGSYFLTLLFKG